MRHDLNNAMKYVLKMDQNGVLFETLFNDLFDELIQTSNLKQAMELSLKCNDDVQRASSLLLIAIEYLGKNDREQALNVIEKIEFDNETTFENYVAPSKLMMGYTLIWMIVRELSIKEALQGISLICYELDAIGNAKRASELLT